VTDPAPGHGAILGAVPRFLTLADVAEVLNISSAQTYALVRTGDLKAIKVGGRGQWRVEGTELEAYIQRMYAQTASLIDHDDLAGSEVSAHRVSDAGELPDPARG
jgi:excisionase family DNA binding protein